MKKRRIPKFRKPKPGEIERSIKNYNELVEYIRKLDIPPGDAAKTVREMREKD